MAAKRTTKFRFKNITIILIVLVALFLTAGLIYLNAVEDKLADEATENILRETQNTATFIAAEFNNTLDEVVSISYSLSNTTKEVSEILEFLKFYAAKSNYLRFTYYDLEGNAVGTDGITRNIKDSYTFSENIAGNPAIAKPSLDTSGIAEIIAFSAPVPLNGEMQYGIIGSRYVASMMKEVSETFYKGMGYTYVVDSTGEILIYPDSPLYAPGGSNLLERIKTEQIPQEKLVNFENGLKTHQSYSVSFPFDGKTKIVSYAPIEGINDWFIVCVIPDYNISYNQLQIITYSVIMLLVIVLVLILIFWQITAIQKKNNQRIKELAFVDDLTGYNNINKFKIDATTLLIRNFGQRYALVKFDINKFKLINDMFGFEEGDAVIKNIAKALHETVSDAEIFGRIASDDFVFLTKYTDDDEAVISKGKNLISRFHEINAQHEKNYSIDFSIGIYIGDGYDDEVVTMIEKASMAHSFAKNKEGAVCAIYNDEIRNEEIHTREIENSMQRALDNGEFLVHVQPKYDFKTERIVGGESLARWQHPEKGIIGPNEFIPIFEKNGFITKMDYYILEETCKHLQKLLNEGITPVQLSVNQSRLHLNNPDYVKEVVEIIRKYDIPSKYIELELTETAIHDNIEDLIRIAKELHSFGYAISMDDFGSGYSSLNMLKELPVDVLKIDKVFLNKTEDDDRGRIVLSNIIHLAKELKMQVVAEGVETLEQVNLLRSLNCDIAQGYYFSRPIPLLDFDNLYAEQFYKNDM